MTFDGEKLRLARLFFGWSQAELGERVAASRQFIHQLELETKIPSQDMRRALAAALSVDPKFFELAIKNPVKPEQAHFRQLRTTSLAEKRQVLAHVTFFEKFVELLESNFELPRVDIPEREIETIWSIDRIAEETRRHFGLGLSSPIKSMTRVLERAGIVVVSFESVGEKVDALSVSRARPIVIRSSGKQSVFRQRFDYAHELGHLVMHQGIETGDRDTEGQAHRFASAFLMPREAIMAAFPSSRSVNLDRIFQFKLKWGVAAAAAIRRLYDLNVIDAAYYRQLNIKMSKLGQRKVERYDDKYPLETSEIIPQCIKKMREGNGPGIIAACRALNIHEAFLSRLIGETIEEERQPSSGSVVHFRARPSHS